MPLERITGSIAVRDGLSITNSTLARLAKLGLSIADLFGNPPTATGSSAVAIGRGGPNASANNSIAIGTSTAAIADNSIAIGASASGSEADAIAIGQSTTAGHQEAIAIGLGATSLFAGDVVWGWGGSGNIGRHNVCLGELAINDDTPTNLQLTDGSSGISIATSHMYGITGQVLGKQSGSPNVVYYTFECIVKNIAGTVTIPFSNITEHLDETTGVSVALVADNIGKKFQIEITGLAATVIRWSAEMRITHMIRS